MDPIVEIIAITQSRKIGYSRFSVFATAVHETKAEKISWEKIHRKVSIGSELLIAKFSPKAKIQGII